MHETFVIPCVGAIVERTVNDEPCVLVQMRWKDGGGETNGKLEIVGGKIREYEDIFQALRREVYEETGLCVTTVQGERDQMKDESSQAAFQSFEPFCITQNLRGAYSILLLTFLCEAEGEPLKETNEAREIRWMPVSQLRESVEKHPEDWFFMHLNELRKYVAQK